MAKPKRTKRWHECLRRINPDDRHLFEKLSNRLLYNLANLNITSAEQLIHAHREYGGWRFLLALPNVGWGSVDEIEEVFAAEWLRHLPKQVDEQDDTL